MKCSWITLAPLVLAAACLAGDKDQDKPDRRPFRDFRGQRGAVQQVFFTASGSELVSASADGRVYVWNVAEGSLIRQIFPRERSVKADLMTGPHSRRIDCIAPSPDGKYIAETAVEATQETVVRIWDKQTGEPAWEVLRGRKHVRCLTFTPDGKYLVYSEQDPRRWAEKIVFLDTKTRTVAFELTEKRLAVTNLVVSPNGKRLAASGPRRIMIWDLDRRKLTHTIKAHKKVIRSIAFSPNSKLLLSGSMDDTVRVWDVETGKRTLKIKAGQDGVLAVAFSPSGRTIASGGTNHTIKLWKPKSGKLRWRLWGHLDRVLCLAFSHDGKTLASGSRDTTIALWKIVEPEHEEEPELEDDEDWKD